jgi:hypothetical protein
MKRAKQRKFRLPTPMCWFPVSFVAANLAWDVGAGDETRVLVGEIGIIEGVRFITTIHQDGAPS